MTEKLLNFDEILEEDLVRDLDWLKEEFEILFNSKIGNHTVMDKKIANDVLDYSLEKSNVRGNIGLLYFLDQVVKNIEKKYSILLN